MITDPKNQRGPRRGWFRNANIPVRFEGRELVDVDLDVYPRQDVRLMARWADAVADGAIVGRTGKGILLAGQPGHGKTLLACALANEVMLHTPASTFGILAGEYRQAKRPVYFTRWTSLLDCQKEMMDGADANSLAAQVVGGAAGSYADPSLNIQVLVLDDVGREHAATGWNSAQLDRLLRIRFDLGLPTIITSNIPVRATGQRDWARTYGDATADLVEESSVVIDLVHAHGSQRQPA